MGFMDGLAQALGSFNEVRRIDSDGFDWREKDEQARFARERERLTAQQADEDRAVGQMADYMSSADEPDTAVAESVLPKQIDKARRQFLVGTAAGKAKQSKSALAAQKAYTDRMLQTDKDAAAIERERYKGEMRLKLAQAAEEIRQNQQMSPREKEAALLRIQAQNELFDRAEAGRNSRAAMGTVRPLLDNSGAIDGLYNSRTGAGQPAPDGVAGKRTTVPATQIEAQNIGAAQAGGLETIKELYNPEWVGPIAGGVEYSALTKIPGLPAPDERRVKLTTAVAGLRNDVIKARTGAQMSEKEVPRLSEEIPLMTDKPEVFLSKLQLTTARVQILNAVRDGRISRQEAARLINEASLGEAPVIPPMRRTAPPGAPVTPQAGSPQVRTFGGRQFRLKQGADPKLKSSWEEVR